MLSGSVDVFHGHQGTFLSHQEYCHSVVTTLHAAGLAGRLESDTTADVGEDDLSVCLVFALIFL